MEDWVHEHQDDKGFLGLFNKKYVSEQLRTDMIRRALSGRRDNVSSPFSSPAEAPSNPPFPPETFGNLLLLHCKYGYYDLAADILAENAHLTYKFLPQVSGRWVQGVYRYNL